MSVLNPVIDYWDGVNRHIYLKQGVTEIHWITDIYEEYRHWRRTDEDARKWKPFMRAEGNIPKGGAKFTPRFLIMLDNARVVPFDEGSSITALGEAITDNPDIDSSPFYLDSLTSPIQIYITPSESETIVIDGGTTTILDALNILNEGIKKASKLIPHNNNIN